MILKALRTRTKVIMIAVAVAFVISIFAGYGIYSRREGSSATTEKDKVVAKANGTNIMLSQIDMGVRQLMDQMGISNLPQSQYYILRKHVLDQIVLDMELDKEVKDNKIEVTDDEINVAMDRIISQFPTKEAYQDYLSAYNIKEDDLKKELRRQLAQQKLLQTAVKTDDTVTEEEMQEFYEARGDDYFVRPEGLWVNFAVFSDDKTAQEVRDALASGQTWDDVMSKYGDKALHSTSYDKPLLLPMTTLEAQEELLPLKELKEGELSQPIQLDEEQFGIYLVKGYQKQEKIPYDEVKENIKLALSQQKAQAQRQEYLQGLVDRANVEIVDSSVFEAPKVEEPAQPSAEEEGDQGSDVGAEVVEEGQSENQAESQTAEQTETDAKEEAQQQ